MLFSYSVGFLRALLYLCFLIIMVHIHALPLFALRPMYLSIRNFKKTLQDVILSRRAIMYANSQSNYSGTTEI